MSDHQSTAEPAETEAPSCSLTETQKRDREQWVREELLPHYREAELVENGFHASFDASEDSLVALAQFLDRESVCCSSFTFEITYTPPYEAVQLRITGPEGTRDLLEEGLADRFERITVAD